MHTAALNNNTRCLTIAFQLYMLATAIPTAIVMVMKAYVMFIKVRAKAIAPDRLARSYC